MRNLSAPITAHIEITEACDERCRHCYNFCRGESFKPQSISWENLDNTISELIKNKVMHVIITGGEPLLAVEKTIYLAKKCTNAGMTISLNSNLVSATPDKMGKLKDAGVDHCLTTLFSHKPEVHNFMASAKTWHKVIRGIKVTQEAGIRVSVNAIVSEHNKGDVFEAGKLLYKMGVKKFMANRCIPSQNNKGSLQQEFLAGKEQTQKMFSDLKRVRALGIEVQSCRTTPECFFDDPDGDDLEFTHRGCHAMTQILTDVQGNARACPHEGETYGNIHEIGIKGVWGNMRVWRSGEYIPEECQNCPRLETCQAGCRMVALYYTDSIKGCDNLRRGNPKPPKLDTMINIREEDGFYILRKRGAKVGFIDK